MPPKQLKFTYGETTLKIATDTRYANLEDQYGHSQTHSLQDFLRDPENKGLCGIQLVVALAVYNLALAHEILARLIPLDVLNYAIANHNTRLIELLADHVGVYFTQTTDMPPWAENILSLTQHANTQKRVQKISLGKLNQEHKKANVHS